jgi:hypothetical protein
MKGGRGSQDWATDALVLQIDLRRARAQQTEDPLYSIVWSLQ